MTEPERALEHAREAAASMRAAGAYGEDHRGPEVAPTGAITTGKLFEWALIDPDLRNVRSTRRFGAPMTALKLGLVRLLAQYHGELIAEQTRFNVNLVGHVRRLEERIEELERRQEHRGPQ
ncbi:MAG: hypothetical protein ACR2LV_03295 [Solirubrobacteraceae bacterium]